jgi:hypothetical protein
VYNTTILSDQTKKENQMTTNQTPAPISEDEVKEAISAYDQQTMEMEESISVEHLTPLQPVDFNTFVFAMRKGA